ncbi:MAG: phosphonate ABC transporter, permease protein PhnE [Chloroflexia bacterium]|nr:phosphonate ABC transporter, permease protein PhnE [Chloroflexia bacterium]
MPTAVRDNPLTEPLRLPSLPRLAIVVAVAGVIVWAWLGVGITIPALVAGLPAMADFISRLFPPDWSEIGDAVPPLIQTLQMAIIGTLLGVLIAVPLALLAASNVSPHPMVYQAFRVVLNIGRTIPELVLALAFVAAVGLGTFPGTLALALHSVCSLSKIFAESIEAINPRPVEAVVAAGAGRIQTIAFAMLPQALPTMTSYSLLYWEHNVRAATVLGLVGAGGIGFEIQKAMRLFQYNDLTTYVLMLVVMVTLLDRASAWLRARIT